MRHVWLTFVAIAGIFAALAWGNDYFTLQGERTIYTVDCKEGGWKGDECTGKLLSGDRYRFRALKAHREVLFWTSGSSEPSGKYTDCVIHNGRNWSCKPNSDTPRTIAYQMVKGKPVREPGSAAQPFHCVSKLRWWLIKQGIPTGNSVIS